MVSYSLCKYTAKKLAKPLRNVSNSPHNHSLAKDRHRCVVICGNLFDVGCIGAQQLVIYKLTDSMHTTSVSFFLEEEGGGDKCDYAATKPVFRYSSQAKSCRKQPGGKVNRYTKL